MAKKVKAEATDETKAEKPAKAAKAEKPAKAAKAEKPAKAEKAAKAEKPAKAAKEKAKLDKWGFRENSLKSKAAAMYAAGKGATLAEVKKALNSSQLNLLTELEGKGCTVEKKKVDGPAGKQVTRYKLKAPAKEAA